MKIKTFKDGIIIFLTNFKTIELWFKVWNPLEYIAIRRSFEIYLKGDHSPMFDFYFAFIFFSISLEFYDNRHENEKFLLK